MKRPIPGQVIESVDPTRIANYREWLESWIERAQAGERVTILIGRDGRHAVVIAR